MTGLKNVWHGIKKTIEKLFGVNEATVESYLDVILPQLKKVATEDLQAIAKAALDAIGHAAVNGTHDEEALLDVAYEGAKEEAEILAPHLGPSALNIIGTAVVAHAQDQAEKGGQTIAEAAHEANSQGTA